MRNEGRDIDLEQTTPNVVHPGLHLDYDLDFRTQRVDDIAPTLTSPLLSGLISNICLLRRPVIPNKPLSPKVEGACGVTAELPLGQMHQAHLMMAASTPGTSR